MYETKIDNGQNIEERSIESLKPYARNARTHSKKPIKQTVAIRRQATQPMMQLRRARGQLLRAWATVGFWAVIGWFAATLIDSGKMRVDEGEYLQDQKYLSNV